MLGVRGLRAELRYDRGLRLMDTFVELTNRVGLERWCVEQWDGSSTNKGNGGDDPWGVGLQNLPHRLRQSAFAQGAACRKIETKRLQRVRS